ncbi:type II secretion system protein GspK [Gallaecimonas kandeliae]|uniref:general secretion pathway protein GspK n=1 Tax=Gallaecimonas kandeliae TaxID=3029055 RepID=UPI0026483133|nr:type II secretion system protein GspK [Gallaecimonas kandeliae]WKE65667.1 type II secretion system protein GspK [Gallaecimonas kandeliae]
MKSKAATDQGGIALVAVLWLLALLSLMATVLAGTSREQGLQARYLAEDARGRKAAEGAIRLAGFNLGLPANQRPWLADGGLHQLDIDGIQVSLAIEDERGKLDLNAINEELLTNLLLAAGVDKDQVPALTDAILDWRDPDDLKRLHGAEEADYLAAGRDAGPANAPFDDVDQLQQVLGMTDAIYQKLAPVLTVKNHRLGVMPLYAPRLVLMALPGASADLVDGYIQERRQNQENGLPPPPFPLSGPLTSGGGIGLNYTIHTDARVSDHTHTRLTAEVQKRSGLADAPLVVVRIQRSAANPEGYEESP